MYEASLVVTVRCGVPPLYTGDSHKLFSGQIGKIVSMGAKQMPFSSEKRITKDGDALVSCAIKMYVICTQPTRFDISSFMGLPGKESIQALSKPPDLVLSMIDLKSRRGRVPDGGL